MHNSLMRLSFLLALGLSAGHFSDGEAATLSEEIETIRVTGSRLNHSDDDWKAGLTVVNRQDIERLATSDFVELIRTVPGVYVNQPGGGGQVASLHLRGAEPNYTLVLVDGVAITDPTDSRGGSFNLMALDPALIERVEVLNGAAISLYGPGALAGVINIETRLPKPGASIYGKGETDFDGYGRVNGGLSLITDSGLGISFNAAHLDTGELVSGGSVESDQLAMSIYLPISADTRLRAVGRISETDETGFPEESGGIELAIFRDLDQRQTEQAHVSLAVESQLGEEVSLNSHASYFCQDKQEDSPGVFPGNQIPPNGAATTFERLTWRADIAYTNQNWGTAFGVAYEHEDGESMGYLFAPGVFDLPFELERDTYGAFVEVSANLSQGFEARGALRVDSVSGLKTRLSGSVSLIKSFAENGPSLRLWVMNGFKPPSFFALGHPLTGNPDLKPERSLTSEAALRVPIAVDTAIIEFSLFYDRYLDQVDFDSISFTHVNRERYTVKGSEISLDYTPHPSIHIAMAATYADGDIKGLDRPARGRPKWLFNMQADWLPSANVSLGMTGRYNSQLFANSFVTGPVFLEGSLVFDLRAAWQITSGIRVEATIFNITDQKYKEAVGVPSAGTEGRFGLGLEF